MSERCITLIVAIAVVFSIVFGGLWVREELQNYYDSHDLFEEMFGIDEMLEDLH